MKRFIVITLLCAALLSGCATTGFLGFLATTSYVNKKITDEGAKTKTALDQKGADIEQVRKDVQAFKNLSDQIQKLFDEVTKTQQTTAELQNLAKAVESRMGSIPRETLQQLVEILQAYLKESQK